MDAFYTSVEQRDHPEYRGRPVVVGADPKEGRGRGVVAASSYEARKFGVRSAMPISRAYRLCPQAVYLRGRMDHYVSVSKSIMSVLRSYSQKIEPISIDEAFLDLSLICRPDTARELGAELKEKIWERESLRASVGIAENKFLAKVASDLEKPDGLVQVQPGAALEFLAPLPVERLWGVGPKTAERLHRLGIETIGQLRGRSLDSIGMGKHGAHLLRLASGLDDRSVVSSRRAKSIGHETTFAEDIDDLEVLTRTILDLSERVASRLRKKNLRCRRVSLKFRNEHFVTQTRDLSFAEPIDDGAAIHAVAMRLLERVERGSLKTRLVGVSAGKLVASSEKPAQMSLFGSESIPSSAGADRKRRLNQAVDSLESRFGDSSVAPASLVSGRVNVAKP